MSDQINLWDVDPEYKPKPKTLGEVFGAKESYQLPGLIMTALLGHDTEKIKAAAGIVSDMSDYFQSDAGDRKNLKQDFTPDCVCRLVAGLMKPGNFIDMCAGTGGLTQAAIQAGHGEFYAQEVSTRTIPFNLLNAAIHGFTGTLQEADVLRQQIQNEYHIADGYVTQTPIHETQQFDNTIMNPPYSLKFPDAAEYTKDFHGMAIPTSKADYGFVLRGLEHLKDDGRLIAILPHGVLFRGQKEAAIRTQIVEKHLLSAVIGLPDNMFLNTGIPVFLMILQRGSRDVLMIDASREYEKHGKTNVMTDEDIGKAIDTFAGRKSVERYSRIITLKEIRDNGYNLNIPRYVDSRPPEAPIDVAKEIRELEELKAAEAAAYSQLAGMLRQLTAEDPDDMEIIQRHIAVCEGST